MESSRARRRVDKLGRTSWDGKHVFISTAIAHEDIDLRYDGGVTWDAVFGALSIGVLTEGRGGPNSVHQKAG